MKIFLVRHGDADAELPEVETIAVTQGTGTLYSETFNRRPVLWRRREGSGRTTPAAHGAGAAPVR